MDKDSYIEQQIALGCNLHKHDGVWWEQQSPFHCRPAVRLERIVPGVSRPSRLRSIAGYRHVVPEGEKSNSSCSVMRLEWKQDRPFEIADLSSSRRSKVRRGQKKNEIKLIEDLEPLIEEVKDVVVSTRKRSGVGLPVKYYADHYQKWRKDMLNLFNMEDRFWWGAFVSGRLIAYYQVTVVEDTLFVGAVKSHTDFLAGYPNDALLYSVLEDAFNRIGCRYVEYGEWTPNDERLLYFKQSYGFTRHESPEYVHINPCFRPIQKIRRSLRKRKRR